MDIQTLIGRVLGLIKAPKEEWPKIKQGSEDFKTVCINYYLPLIALSVIAGFIQKCIIGYPSFSMDGNSMPTFGIQHDSIVSGIVNAIIALAFTFAGSYIMAMIIQKLAPKFNCNPSFVDCFKYLTFAGALSCVGSLIALVPLVGWIVMLVLVIYGIYVALVGFPVMTGVPSDKKWPFIITTIICGIVVSVVWVLVLGVVHMIV